MTDRPVRFCPHCGTAVSRTVLFGEERPVCPSCGWVYFADPKVAAAVVVEQDGLVLLIQRINEPFRGLWSLPAGFVNAHEDPARAAERECLEETGLVVQVSGLLDVLTGREHTRGADILLVYRAEILSGEARAGDDAGAVGFFRYQALPPLAFETTRKILSR